MLVYDVTPFPFIFQKSGKSTIIRNLAVPCHFVAYLVFISSICVDPVLSQEKADELAFIKSTHQSILRTFMK
jgi:hypothetical protein